MSIQNQKELIGNAPYLEIVEPGSVDGSGLRAGSPEDVEAFESDNKDLHDRLYSELEHDESGLDTERVSNFLSSYGLDLQPFIAVPPTSVDKLEHVLGQRVNEEGKILGQHLIGPEVTYVIRDEDLEEANGTGVTESILVHEEAHANSSLYTLAYMKDKNGTVASIELRGGFLVNDEGHFFEEGFAALMEHRFVVEALGKPNGFSEWGGAQTVSTHGQEFKMPRSYWFPTTSTNRFGGASTPSFAGYGMELLIAKDPRILESMIKARNSVEGLREFAKKVNELKAGLYSLLRRQPYKLDNFMAATDHIVQELYDGDYDKAVAAASELSSPENSST